jgi:hypothetical protein
MRGNINKMKRRENLESELGGSQPTLKIDREEKKMVVTLSNKGRNCFLKVDKF